MVSGAPPRAGEEWSLPQLRDFLERFRPAGAPGAARAGVPADRSRELEAELSPVLALLEGVDAECARIVAQARHDAGQIIAAARDEAAAGLADADQRARSARDEVMREILAVARAEAAAAVAEAARQASQERELAGQRIPVLAATAVGLVRELDRQAGTARGPAGWAGHSRRAVMSAGWVAGSVRARAMAQRQLGAAAARRLAACGSLADAQRVLAATHYAREDQPGQTLAGAQHAVAEGLLWDLRVLAGWLPREGVGLLRTLAGWFEIANVDELLQSLAGPAGRGAVPARCAGDGLAPAAPCPQSSPGCGPRWRPRPGGTRAVTPVLTSGSACGCAGRRGSRRAAIRPGPGRRAQWRCCWPGNGSPRPGAAAPATAYRRDQLRGEQHRPGWRAGPARPGRGVRRDAQRTGDALPGQARWALAGVSSPGRAVAGRGRVVGAGRSRRARAAADLGPDSGPVLGAVAVLAADARRVCAALEIGGARRRAAGDLRCGGLTRSRRSGCGALPLVAPEDALRDVLVRVAAAAAVEIDDRQPRAGRAAGRGGAAAELAQVRRARASPDARRPDLSVLEQAGRYDLLTGEAQLEAYAAAAVRRGRGGGPGGLDPGRRGCRRWRAALAPRPAARSSPAAPAGSGRAHAAARPRRPRRR